MSPKHEYILGHATHFLVSETKEHHVVLLYTAFYSIGRKTDNDICLLSDTISRNHAQLVQVQSGDIEKYQLIDGNCDGDRSRNGVRVNGQPATCRLLNNRDWLSFGGVMNFTYINGDDILDYLIDITPERIHHHRLQLNSQLFLSSQDATSIMMGGPCKNSYSSIV